MRIFLLCLFSFTLLSAQENAAWLRTAESIDPNEYYGVTSANGMLGIVSSPLPLQVKDVVLNGVYDRYGRGRVSNILKGFNFADVHLAVQPAGTPTQRQRVEAGNISRHRQQLDMRYGTFRSTFSHRDLVDVRYEVSALRHLPFNSLIRVEITAKADVEVFPSATLRAPEILRDVQQFYSVIDRPHAVIPLMTSVAQSPTGKHTVAASVSFAFGNHNLDAPDLVHEEWDYDFHLVRFRKRLKRGETYAFDIIAAEISTEHTPDPQNEAERLAIYAALEGGERLRQRHKSAWEEIWSGGDIEVEGDVRVQRDIRFHLYHLYAFARAGTAYSLSPMGLSGLGYNGHVFWDTELWMFPPLAVLQPDMARSLLEYRFQRLEVARQNAFSHGYEGAMFPWESDDNGQEATPVWALTGPFEHHITGDVGFAFWTYYQITQDKAWLRERGYPVLKEVADFWVSRVETDDEGVCHIRNVVAADEWAENVDNNAFTNGVAIYSLRAAAKAARVLGIEAPDTWEATAGCIPILRFEDGTVREHATYVDTTIKQADVNLLTFPLGLIEDERTMRKNLEFYQPRVDAGGPAMAQSVFSIISARLGDAQVAGELFLRGYRPNEVPPFGVLAETAGGTNPYFATGAGGMLQAVLFGFGGLQITDEGIEQESALLPPGWRSMRIIGVGAEEKTYRVE